VTTPPPNYVHEYPFILVSPYPRVEYPAQDLDKTIASMANWWPSANLLVEPLESTSDTES
jgi:hypothetical protein